MTAATATKVLIVEDEQLIAMDTQGFLADHGILSDISRSGEDAVRLLRDCREYGLVLMDLDLGDGIDGIEAARKIVSSYKLPVLFLSSHTEWDLVERLKDVEHYGFLPKTAGNFALLQGVTASLKLSETRRVLVERENQYRSVLESVSDAIAVIDTDFAVRAVNRSAKALFGATVESVGELCHRCFYGLEAPCAWCPAVAALSSGTTARTVIALPAESGGPHWYHIESSPVWGESGTIIGAVISGRDMTAEEESKQQLLESREMFQEFFHWAPLPYQSLDTEGRLTEVNEAWCRALGYEREEVVGTAFEEILPPAAKPRFRKCLARFKHQGVVTDVEFPLRTKGGDLLIARFAGRMVYDEDGAPVRCHCIFQNMTAERRAEERFQKLFENAPLGIFRSTIEGRFIDVNPALATLLGYDSPEEVLSEVTDIAGQIYTDPEQRAEVVEFVRHGKGQQVFELDYRRRNGEVWLGKLHLHVLRDPAGEPEILEGFVEDITEVSKRHRQVEALLEERELLLKEVHHRIKNDMLLIRSLLSLQAGRATSDEVAAELTDAGSRITLMGRIYDRLYRTEGYSHIQLRPTIESLVRDFLSGAGRRDVQLTMEIEEATLPRRIAMPAGIVVNELVNNSVKYAYEGTAAPRLFVGARVHDHAVELVVRDNGCGLPDSLRRNDGSIDIGQAGGFGFTLVAGLVTQHRGSLHLEDTADGGTTATVVLGILDE